MINIEFCPLPQQDFFLWRINLKYFLNPIIPSVLKTNEIMKGGGLIARDKGEILGPYYQKSIFRILRTDCLQIIIQCIIQEIYEVYL